MLRIPKHKRAFPRRMIPFCTGICVGAVAALLYFSVLWYICFFG